MKVYNLEEFATKYNLKDIYGAYAAHFYVNGEEGDCFSDFDTYEDNSFCSMVAERTLFTKLLLVQRGSCLMQLHEDDAEQSVQLTAHDMLITTPKEVASVSNFSADFEAEGILVDETFAKQAQRYQLNDTKYKSISDIFQFVRDIVRHQHINKVEMIRSMFNVLRLIIDELPYEQCSVSRDLGHKKEVYEVFLHHLYRNYRKERQIRFYADKLNVSTAYLSRLVKEISGSTINEHATSLVYKEISAHADRYDDGRDCRPSQLQRPERHDQLLQAALRHDATRLPQQIKVKKPLPTLPVGEGLVRLKEA